MLKYKTFPFLSWLFVHLSTEKYLKALYLWWQKRGLGCGSRWKQACVTRKGIVITKAFEEPPVSNGPYLGRGDQHPLQSTPSKKGEITLRVKLSLLTQHKLRSWTEAAALCVTTISIHNEPIWFVSSQQLSEKREAEVSPLKLTEHPTWCQQMADRRRNLPSQLPVYQPASAPRIISSGYRKLPLPPHSQIYSQVPSPSTTLLSYSCHTQTIKRLILVLI